MSEDEGSLYSESEPGYSEYSSESEESNISPARKKINVKANIAFTQYSVVKEVFRKVFNWKLSANEESEDWDIMWCDGFVPPEKLSKMKQYQKINHFPGMYNIARKNLLCKNLNLMQKQFPADYNFFPITYNLPFDNNELRAQFKPGKPKTFIVKPEANSQGRGIYLIRYVEDIPLGGERWVAQRYLHKPYLLEGLKFDLRIYVLVTGSDPLRIFVYEEGLARFATSEYRSPNAKNMGDMCMHLTNYAVNKNSENFIFNEDEIEDDVGHKRSLSAVYAQMQEEDDVDIDKLKNEINQMIVKTLVMIQPHLSHIYRTCQTDDPENAMWFQLLGFDILIDYMLKPWLLEVNHAPSFSTDTPLDYSIKQALIQDTVTLLGIKATNRGKVTSRIQANITKASLITRNYAEIKLEKQQEVAIAQKQRTIFENKTIKNLQFKKIYGKETADEYAKYIQAAREMFYDTGFGRQTTLKQKKEEAQAKEAQEKERQKAVRLAKSKSKAAANRAKPLPTNFTRLYDQCKIPTPRRDSNKSKDVDSNIFKKTGGSVGPRTPGHGQFLQLKTIEFKPSISQIQHIKKPDKRPIALVSRVSRGATPLKRLRTSIMHQNDYES